MVSSVVPLIVVAIVFQHQWRWTQDTDLTWYKPYFSRPARWEYVKAFAPDVKSLAPLYNYIKTRLPKQAYILCVNHPYAFYLPRRYMTNDARSPELFKFLLQKFHSLDRVFHFMKDKGITHLLQNGSVEHIEGLAVFEKKYLNLVYQDSNFSLFSLKHNH